MEAAMQSPAQILPGVEPANGSGLFFSESVLSILKLIFAGSPLSEVLTTMARLVQSQGKEHCARSGFLMRTGSNSTSQRRPVFLDLVLT